MSLPSPEAETWQPVPSPDRFRCLEPPAFDAVYEELRRAARRMMAKAAWDERSLDPTGLVNEAVLRLLQSPKVCDHVDPAYVFAAALRAMRQVLCDRARQRKRLKRGGGWRRVPLDGLLDYFEGHHVDVEDLREAIDRLARWDERQAEVVTMRYYLGMNVVEIARQKGLSSCTVEGDLRLARAWLRRELGEEVPESVAV